MFGIKPLAIIKTAFVIAAFDAVYLGVIQHDYLMRYFSRLNGQTKFNIWIGVVVWILLALQLELFVYPYATSKTDAVIKAAVLGLLTYAVYDLTNLATLTNWTTSFSLIDILWGGIVMALTTIVRYNFLV